MFLQIQCVWIKMYIFANRYAGERKVPGDIIYFAEYGLCGVKDIGFPIRVVCFISYWHGMEKIKLIKKIVRWTVLILGFGLVLGGAYGLDSVTNIKKQYVPVTGIIKDIKKFKGYRHRKRYVHYDVTVNYQTPQGMRETKLGIYSAGMKVGKGIAVWYNPDQPDEIRVLNKEKFVYYVLILTGVLLLMSGWLLLPWVFGKMGQNVSGLLS